MRLRNALSRFQADALYLSRSQEVACLTSDAVGEIMCIRDVQTVTGRWRVQRADPSDIAKMPGVGILISKQTPTTGVMVRVGPVENIFSGLDVTKSVFVGASGTLVQVPPSPGPGGFMRVQKFGYPVAADVVWLTGEIGQVIIRRG